MCIHYLNPNERRTGRVKDTKPKEPRRFGQWSTGEQKSKGLQRYQRSEHRGKGSRNFYFFILSKRYQNHLETPLPLIYGHRLDSKLDFYTTIENLRTVCGPFEILLKNPLLITFISPGYCRQVPLFIEIVYRRKGLELDK